MVLRYYALPRPLGRSLDWFEPVADSPDRAQQARIACIVLNL